MTMRLPEMVRRSIVLCVLAVVSGCSEDKPKVVQVSAANGVCALNDAGVVTYWGRLGYTTNRTP